MTTEFTDLNLHPQLLQAVTERGYTTPTPIQTGVIPVMLAGHDVIGQAQTGTGKTAAFTLPTLHKIEPNAGYVQSLVLAPTRELAIQVAKATYEYGNIRNISVLAIYGGSSYSRQKSRLRRGVDVVVGTPGRMLDLIKQKSLDLSQVQTVVLDEADEMLSMGFIEDIESILDETPTERQTALFSATLPQGIRKLADKYLTNPESITIRKKHLTVDAIKQSYFLFNEVDKLSALTRLFEVEDMTSGLVFARTRVATGDLASELSKRGFPAEALNGDLSQDAREQVLNRFRKNQIKVLVATDVAARGLDIDDISHVFNFDIPQDPEVYVHRIGRTGRAGKSGIAVSFFTPKEHWRLRRIEQFARTKIERATLPTVDQIQAHREGLLLKKMDVWLNRARYSREKEMVMALVESGHDPLEIASAALKLARAEEKQRPIPRIRKAEEARPSDRFGGRGGRGRRNGNRNGNRNGRSRGQGSREVGMVRLSLSAGKAQGIRPNDVVGTIAFHANIPGSTIGAIRIQDQHTFVDVPERFVPQVLDKSGRYRIHQQRVHVELVQ
ncbi:MAG: DEAD/DEAH box helicase [Chloroflexi bacterium]|nr:DEAD/DEAH box helicase [Chloroflexota bacterium]